MSIRDRLDTLSRGELAGLVAVLVVTLAGAGLWYTRSLPRPVQIAGPSPGPAAAVGPGAASGTSVASTSPSGAPVIVDVTGWVKDPGVYEFGPGDRVIDAVNRAGGARKGADLTSINLAALLTDGSQVVIPKNGAGTISAGGTAPGPTGVGGAPMVNINVASESELESLSGVGPVLANAIIQYRTQHGLFHTVDDLLDVSGIGPATLEELRPQVTV
ncbi:MAG: helix-hairpin-helix domain-containing protein [Actinomycetota bacterium]|nr:helix-hairpin-helix domain-containing protein [Actinomycetota bacterium]